MSEATTSGETPLTGAPRERMLADTFVDLADTLVDNYDVSELLNRLVAACVNLFGVTAAGLLLRDQRGSLSVVASSSEETRLLELFQLQSDQGPCVDCVSSAAQVMSGDLASETTRWPRFVPAALAVGFGSVVAVPLRLRNQTVGALNLFDARPVLMAEADQRAAQALADVATIGILQHRSLHRSTVLAEQLQHALNSRVVIEQAKGIVAERGDVTMEVAFQTMRTYARNRNLHLSDVAQSVVDGSIDPAAGT
jgi:transcriptional regulator with GAF, ATPase, and Fis domain